MDAFLNLIHRVYNPIDCLWHSDKTHKSVSALLVLIFLSSLLIIELGRNAISFANLDHFANLKHFSAINLAFTLILIMEVISLIFAISSSLSKALGKQFEILALIFMRDSFKELSHLPEPVTIAGHMDVFWHIVTYGAGAVAIFALLGIYSRLRNNLDETLQGASLYRFIAAKKGLALVILSIFLLMGLYNGFLWISGQPVFEFFPYFYTVLIFSDILMILIAQCFLPRFPAVFRNSGFALSTLLIRLALTAPIYHNVIIGISSVLLALVLTVVSNRLFSKS